MLTPAVSTAHALAAHAFTLLAHLQPALAGGGSGGGAAAPAGGGSGGGSPGGAAGGGMLSMLFPLAIVGFMYFFMIRPANKQRKEQEELQKNLVVGDEVLTNSGMVGKIVKIDDRLITLELSEKTRARFVRDSITGRYGGTAASAADAGSKK